MIRSLYTAASGMAAQQLSMDLTANNLANANTTGYKKVSARFADLLYQQLAPRGGPAAAGVQVGNGVRLAATVRSFSQGTLQNTGNPLDVAITGDGFFQVRRADGSDAYTRSGAFHVDAQGRLVTGAGDLVLGQDGAVISVPTNAAQVTIAPDGTVSTLNNGQLQAVAQFRLVLFPNAGGLQAQGGNLLGATAAAGAPVLTTPGAAGAGKVAAGMLEAANVEMVDEMVNLIVAQRVYELNSKAVQSSDEALSIANNLRR